MKLKDYEFGVEAWPPPREKQNSDTYLVGFDSDYQPYLLRWENKSNAQGWCATTLQTTNSYSASPIYYDGREVPRRINYWAEMPVRKSVVQKYGKSEYASDSSYCGSCGSKHH